MDPFHIERDRWFRGYLDHHPEEATTLGIAGYDARMHDASEAGYAQELGVHQGLLDALAHLGPLSGEDALDADAMRRLARFRVHTLADLHIHERSLELSIHPHAMLGHHVAHIASASEWETFASRLAELPRLLTQREENLRRGLRSGWIPDAVLARHFAEDLLPGAAKWLAALPSLPSRRAHHLPAEGLARLERAGAAASSAMRSHAAFVQAHIVPPSSDTWAVGEEEYRLRLEGFFGLRMTPAELAAEGRERLLVAQGELIARADRLARRGGERVTDLTQATAMVRRLFSQCLTNAEDVVPLYRGLVDRGARFVEERGLFRLPSGWELGIVPIPEGMVHGGGATNWPAPLCDRSRRGHLAVSLEPGMHSTPAAANLTVHEAIPGHYLQSAAWQRGFAAQPSPVRFLCVADDEAMVQQYFGPMLNVEGFAVWAEELLFHEGYLDDEEAVCFAASQVIRAARVVLDVELHTRPMTREQAARTMEEATGLSARWCAGQALRYTRIPIQAVTYDVGVREIRRVWDAARAAEGARFNPAGFHDRFFSFGPLPPATILAQWSADASSLA
jgi:uncharacterized protein (DUF885 family)